MPILILYARPTQDHGHGWSALWDSNSSDLWDRGKPSPALIDLLEQQPPAVSPFTADGRRKKALVPVFSPQVCIQSVPPI